jgi:hypothetical protein
MGVTCDVDRGGWCGFGVAVSFAYGYTVRYEKVRVEGNGPTLFDDALVVHLSKPTVTTEVRGNVSVRLSSLRPVRARRY